MSKDHLPPRRPSRTGFTIVVAPLILGITLVGLGVIYAVQNQTPITPNGPRPLSLKVVSGVTVIAGWLFVMASPWAEKRGHKSANIFFGAILLLFNLAMLNAVTGWSASMRARNSPRITPAAPSSPPPIAITPTPPSATPSQPSPAAVTPNATLEAPSPGQRATAPPESPRPRPAPALTAPVREAKVDLEPVAKQLESEINAEVELRAADAIAMYTIIEKPKRDRKQIDEQLNSLRDKEAQFKKTSARLRDVLEEFRARAETNSHDHGDIIRRSMKLSKDVESFDRGNACDSMARACDTGIEYLTILRDNLGKWSYNNKGELTTRDKALEHQLFVPKARIAHALDEKAENLRILGAH